MPPRRRDADFVLHVVRPEHPLPLDPEFYLGRIDADTLIGMGYRDARAYLDSMTAAGLAKDANCTAMTEPRRASASPTRSGAGKASPVTVQSHGGPPPDPGDDAPGSAAILDHAPFGPRVFLAGGRVETRGGSVTYRASASRAERMAPLGRDQDVPR